MYNSKIGEAQKIYEKTEKLYHKYDNDYYKTQFRIV